jgi:anti-sigma B factor antagonist
MKFTHEKAGRATVIRISGELTGDHLESIKKIVTDRLADGCDFVIDCSELEFLDSRALEMLLWIQERAAEQLGELRLAAPNDDIRTILRMTRLDNAIECRDDLTLALGSLHG